MEGFGDEEDAEVKHLSHHEIKGIKDDLRTVRYDWRISKILIFLSKVRHG